MTNTVRKIRGIFPVVAAMAFLSADADARAADNPLATKCARFASSVLGLNYHRSETNEIASGQIWRFYAKQKLAVYLPTDKGLQGAKKIAEATWVIEPEDNLCVFKITGLGRQGQTQTYRIVDTSWAIIKIGSEDRHVPDFEDHSAMKTRYCCAMPC